MGKIRFGEIMEKGLEGYFYCWVREPKDDGEVFRREDPSKYWIIDWEESKYTVFKKATLHRPPGLTTLSIRSKDVFKYGVFQLTARLPAWKDGPMLWFGFEVEDLFGGGVVHFLYKNGSLSAYAGAWSDEGPLVMTIPVNGLNLSLKRHTFTIRVHEHLALWFVDSKLKAVAVLADGEKSQVIHEGAPYSLGITALRPSPSMAILLDIDGGPLDKEWSWNDIHPWQLRVLDGSPNPSLIIRLREYGKNTFLDGNIYAEKVVAHPLPALGVNTTFLFKASGKGVLSIQAYTCGNGWTTMDTIHVADNLVKYTVKENPPFIRLAYEPKGVSKIEIAEAYIS